MKVELTFTRRTAGLALSSLLMSAAFPTSTLAQTNGKNLLSEAKPGRAYGVNASPIKVGLLSKAEAVATLWSLDGTAAGPVLRAKPGELCEITVVNDTEALLSLHWHGLRGENAYDGVGGLTQEPIAPGDSFVYRLSLPEPGTCLIRPCIIGATSEPAGRGLTGMLIIEEPQPPAVDTEICAIVDDWLLSASGEIEPFTTMPLGRLGNKLTINGSAIPFSFGGPSGTRIRLRLANACNARAMRIRFDNLKTYVVAVDGQPTDVFEPLRSSLPFCPGNRYDLIFDLPPNTEPTGELVALIGEGQTLMSFRSRTATAGTTKPDITELPPNSRLPAGIKLQEATRLAITIKPILQKDGPSPSGWLVNDRRGEIGMAPVFSVEKDTPIVLAITNDTPVSQPFHINGHCFRLLHPFDDGWDPFWMDTMQIPASTTIRIAFTPDRPGKWLIASTVCERFDTGLWTWFEVS